MVRTYPHFNPFSVLDPENIDWSELFDGGVHFPIDLEIGCSNGRWMLEYAAMNPREQILGVETRNKYVNSLRSRIKELGQQNAAVIRANINTALTKIFKKGQLKNVFIMFPDPWYKKKHLKRRVVQPQFLEELYQLMIPGAQLQIATDKESFAAEMLELLEDSPFRNSYPEYAEDNVRGVVSEIESWHLARNNPVYRLVFNRS